MSGFLRAEHAYRQEAVGRPLRDIHPAPAMRAFAGGLRIRYLTFSDSSKETRRQWLDHLARDYECHVYSDTGTYHLSLAGTDFDVFVVGGNDVVRMAKVVRMGEAILRGRAKIALMADTSPARRARLLTAGYDDVFDAERLHHEEASARLKAIWGRYELRREAESAAHHEDMQLQRICNPRGVNKRERTILLALMQSEDHFLPYYTLQNLISEYHEIISLQSLRVSITYLRKKLHSHVRIVSRSGLGYQLIAERRDSRPECGTLCS